jgi:dihydrofolate reductase
MQFKRKLCLFIAMSLDGYIAKPDGDISFLNEMNHEGEDYGYTAFIDTVGTVILGRKTYDKILSMGIESPYGEREVIVLTHNPQNAIANTSFYSGNLSELISTLKNKSGKNLYCDGGAQTVNQLLQEKLIDEMVVSVIPVLLGDGIRLFGGYFQEQKLKLIECKSFEKGLVQLHYHLQ